MLLVVEREDEQGELFSDHFFLLTNVLQEDSQSSISHARGGLDQRKHLIKSLTKPSDVVKLIQRDEFI